MTTFIKGTVLLTFVLFFSKCIGFLYRMQFMRVAGEEAVGIYMTTYPAFIFFIALVQLGLPVAITKIVAKYAAKGQLEQTKRVYRTALWISTASIVVLLPILAFFMPFLATIFLQNEATKYPLFVALCTVPIVVYASVIRAYLLGLGYITPSAWSSVIEQLIRIGGITLLLPHFLTAQQTLNAAYAMGISALGEVAALLYLFVYYRLLTLPRGAKQRYEAKPLFRIALPSAGSKLFGTFTWFLEPIVFLKALTLSGLTASAATTLYGVISGVHIPLLLFPAFIPAALSIVLVPAISSAAATKNVVLLNERITISLRLCALIGCYAATFFLLYGDFLAYKLFHLQEQTTYMRVLAPIFYFYYIQSPLLSILQALDEAKVAMMNSIYGGIGKLLLMLFLASQPTFQVFGAIIAIGFGVLLTSFLHIATLRRLPHIASGFRLFIVSYSCFVVTAGVQFFFTTQSLAFDATVTFLLLTSCLIMTKQLRLQDVAYVRKLFTRF